MSASPSRSQPLIDTLQVVELAEGVEVQLPVAGVVARAHAFMIDTLIRVFLISLIVGAVALAAMWLFGQGVGIGIYLVGSFLADWFYFVYFEYFRGGVTPGKKSVGLRVVQESGQPITLGQSILRNFLRYVDTFPAVFSLVGVASMVLSGRSQRLGDLAAGTLVIYTDQEKLYPAMLRQVAPPMELPAEVPPVMLTRTEQRAVTDFVERAGIWTDERREELANLVTPLTRASGVEGVRRLVSYNAWFKR
ncbi:RDD family protein [Sulfuriroseicoccus oceanibius]|uniref:RDD family protein n=1 Tax=Sulfuriroseicoccus oceanibius TaxID=2707525 RepID=A0A6B3LCT1_9BACT|nr:RDD family protein [Sulfuriroseicoccus oceanibius]QQL45692.1 RDD family protein [Sulfuriroseicoccus oceanibius]